ncbi:MAG: hybrid sensor histidine kinase/response regulator [Myxococcota bacterium]
MTGDVLVVDDSPQNTEVLHALLTSKGHSVRVANGGHEALRLAEQQAPDLVLLDLHMPDLDGLAVCRALRQQSARLPVVFLSASKESALKVRAFESGAVDFVSKPFHFDEVLARVDTHLQLKRRTEELERANAQLRRLDEVRRHFITGLVHDIKNPLTPLLKNTEWLLGTSGLDGETVEVLRDIHVASNHLHRMVLSLLDVARGTESQLTVRPLRTPLRGWMEEALQLPRLQLRSQPERLQVHVDDGQALFDPDVLGRVLHNLLDNALKYAPRSEPITVEACARGRDGLSLVVEDRGAGIRPEDRERIFTSWTRLESTPLSRTGHGIGLAFCRQAAEAHGGTIHVEDAQPRGARFVVTLPGVG